MDKKKEDLLNDGWSNRGTTEPGPYTVLVADGSNYPGITSFEAARQRADKDPGAVVHQRNVGTVYTAK